MSDAGVIHPEGLDEDREVVRVARDDLEELVLAGDESGVVDPARIHLSEAELGALCEEAARPLERLVDLLLVVVPGGRAVEDDRRALERFLSGVGDLVAEGLEVRRLVLVGREVRAALHEVVDLRALGLHRRALVERDLVDPEVLLEVREETDQRLADRAGPDDVNDVLHSGAPGGGRRRVGVQFIGAAAQDLGSGLAGPC